MATTRIAPEQLGTGDLRRVTVAAQKQATFRFAVEAHTDDFAARLTVVDGNGRRLGAIVTDEPGTRHLRIDKPSEGESLDLIVDVISGRVTASVVELAGTESLALPPGSIKMANLDGIGMKFIPITGADASEAAEAVTATGAAVGDRVVAVIGSATAETAANTKLNHTDDFEGTISVADQVQQLDTDLSANSYWLILLPPAA